MSQRKPHCKMKCNLLFCHLVISQEWLNFNKHLLGKGEYIVHVCNAKHWVSLLKLSLTNIFFKNLFRAIPLSVSKPYVQH